MPTVLITGANRGIGLEFARQLSHRGDQVIACCRESTAELDATGVRVESGVDVTREESITALAERIGDAKIDVLINNAGLLTIEGIDSLNMDDIRRQFEVNALGPLRVTSALRRKMKSGGRIILITSRMGSIADNGSGGAYGYRMSKAALNMAGSSLARDLHKDGIAVGILHPGMVATDMTARFGHGSGMQSPADAAAKLIERIDELTLETTGSFRHGNGEALPW
jgi:NAD(P)-dependent dehydrogenase (short-subunit alcohol dehydrogenase family)